MELVLELEWKAEGWDIDRDEVSWSTAGVYA